MTTIAQALENYFNQKNNQTVTENGAVTNKSTNSKLLDFFSQGGALRTGRGAVNAQSLFLDAYAEDRLLATKALFYFRDIRGGQGERETFRTFLRELAMIDPEVVRKNLHLISYFGRWDDLYALVDTSLENDAFALMREQFETDLVVEQPSLLAKWLKSENTSSPASRALGTKTRKAFGISPKAYRRGLSMLRERIKVLERIISTNSWDKIVYEHVPSQANLKYRKAFGRHDHARYTQYLETVASDKTKINAKTQFPYEIIRNIPMWGYCGNMDETESKALDVMWNAQPDYIGKSENSICVCDTSGSMAGLPIQVSVSLGIYIAERNTGMFHNKFMTFSANPQLQDVVGTDIVTKVNNLSKAHWECNTNVEAVFDTLLNAALNNNIPKSEMIKTVYIISDMEFDKATTARIWDKSIPPLDETLFQTIKLRWERQGYEMPLLVFWNVSSRNEQFPMSLDDRGFVNVSGCSPSIFKNLMKGEIFDAYQFMLEVLNNDRYKVITV